MAPSDWSPIVAVAGGFTLMVGVAYITSPNELPVLSVAFVGNSMQYYNDFPRLMEDLAEGHILQNSCLRGGSTLSSLLEKGNGMAYKWNTMNAIMGVNENNEAIYDFGACSVPQIIFGDDEYIFGGEGDDDDDGGGGGGDDDEAHDGYNGYYLEDDGNNPCLDDSSYYDFLHEEFLEKGFPKWDFIVLNDATRSPCCTESRAKSMQALKQFYVPAFLEAGSIPVFIYTYAYWASDYRDMSGLTDVPTFASLTYNGIQQFVNLVSSYLPESQTPRIAPVGLAFLTIWEENYELWKELIHYDEVHLAPGGTFLQACVVYATIFGKMPPKRLVQDGVEPLFERARIMSKEGEGLKPYPTVDVVDYLYETATRVMKGHIPQSLTLYDSDTSVDFTPDDSQYPDYNE